jgi:hypothetical protein
VAHTLAADPAAVARWESLRFGNEWKTIFTGTTIGQGFEKSFAPVSAREFRLNILEATKGPTITEIDYNAFDKAWMGVTLLALWSIKHLFRFYEQTT